MFSFCISLQRLRKAWTAIDKLSIIWKSNLTDKMKRSFFQAAVVSILLYGCTTWTLTKRQEKTLDGNYTRMLRTILNKSWRQHPTKHQLYGHLPPIVKTIQVRRTRYTGHCLRSRDRLISDVVLWTPTYGRAKVGRPARTYIQQLCGDPRCSPEDLPEAINDREEWRESVRDIRASGTTWWWWWWYSLIMWIIISSLSPYNWLFQICCVLSIFALNSKKKKKEGKLGTYTDPNNAKAYLDYILIRCMNSNFNCAVYSSFEGLSSDHRIVTSKIRLILRSNKKQIVEVHVE